MPKRISRRLRVLSDVWLRELASSDPRLGVDLDYSPEQLRLQAPTGSLCIICKGSRLLCGKVSCPVIARLASQLRIWRSIKGLTIDGSSPPSVFVGRFGYPYVYVGPMAPPYRGDTSILDAPESWFGKSIEEIIGYRTQLVRGMYRAHVRSPIKPDRVLEKTLEVALSESYVETEMRLRSPPQSRFYLDDDVQPLGPSAPLEDIEIGDLKWNMHMEKAHYDTDLRASEAILRLYNSNVPLTQIQRAFSLGSFGIGRNRRLVPTRWSITAIDDMISRELAGRVREYPLLNQFEVYESNYLGNRFIVILVPDAWSYEAYEAWYPKTLWNPSSDHVAIVTDWEGHWGRSGYASMGGCYYAGRLAVLEHLVRMGRQARVFILREAYPDYILPVGVWQVRENVRNAMRQPPKRFNSLEEALRHAMGRLSIPLEHWVNSGFLLRHTLKQRKLTEFL